MTPWTLPRNWSPLTTRPTMHGGYGYGGGYGGGYRGYGGGYGYDGGYSGEYSSLPNSRVGPNKRA